MNPQEELAKGIGHHQSGRLAEANGIYQRLLAEHPDNADLLNLNGGLLAQMGRFDEAIALIQRAISIKPTDANFYGNLGEALRCRGRSAEAIAAFRKSLEIQPRNGQIHFNLGNALQATGQLDQAIASWQEAVELNPDLAMAHSNLGTALREKGQVNAAIAAWRRAIELRPNLAFAHGNLAIALQEQGEHEEAIRLYHRAIQLKPDYAEAYSNLAEALRKRGRLDEAMMACRSAIKIRPNLAEAHGTMGNILKDQGMHDAALGSYRKALALEPTDSNNHSNLLYLLQLHPRQNAEEIFAEHRGWDLAHAMPRKKTVRAQQPFANSRDPNRRLRIGYVSADFSDHSVGYVIEGALAAHHAEAVEIFCYAEVLKPDAMTERIRKSVHQWRNILGLTDAQVVDTVRSDGIDILVDLSGHTGGNRLLAFAEKPAPVSFTYIGYPDTTGLSAMNYRLSDAHADPPGLTDQYHSERVIRLPETFLSYVPSVAAKAAAPAPAVPPSGPVVFGAMNQFAKVNDELLGMWSDVLNRVPGSRLVMKCPMGNTRQRVLDIFSGKNITREQIEFVPRLPMQQYLELYHRIHLALDAFPYHGTVTTLETLWMGVPVVALAGHRHVSRVSASILSNIGMGELIATSREKYVDLAVELVNDLPRLTHLRRGLRERMQRSPLMNYDRMATNLEAAYRSAWQSWCSS